jgi:hypothetical protein
MSEPVDLETFADAQANKLGLSLSGDSRKAVLANLPGLFAMADQVEAALKPSAAKLPEFKL